MTAIAVTFLRTDEETMSLAGCTRAACDDATGALTLSFAADAPGLAAIAQCLADDVDLTGTMTVIGADGGTEYNCAFVERRGDDIAFQLVCID